MILVVGVMLLGTLLPPSVAIAGVSPASIGIVVVAGWPGSASSITFGMSSPGP